MPELRTACSRPTYHIPHKQRPNRSLPTPEVRAHDINMQICRQNCTPRKKMRAKLTKLEALAFFPREIPYFNLARFAKLAELRVVKLVGGTGLPVFFTRQKTEGILGERKLPCMTSVELEKPIGWRAARCMSRRARASPWHPSIDHSVIGHWSFPACRFFAIQS
jgi:hypothetical protein